MEHLTSSMKTETPAEGQSSSQRAPELRDKEAPSLWLFPTDSFIIKNTVRIQKHPDLVHLNMGVNDFFLATNPSLIQEVLVTKQRDFAKGVFLQNTKKVFGEGLLTSEGDFHHRQRRLIQPAFHHDRIKAYATTMTQDEERLTSRWKDGEVLDVHEQMTKLTMAIIAKCLFDKDVESESKEISEDLTTTIEYFNRLSSPLSSIL